MKNSQHRWESIWAQGSKLCVCTCNSKYYHYNPILGDTQICGIFVPYCRFSMTSVVRLFVQNSAFYNNVNFLTSKNIDKITLKFYNRHWVNKPMKFYLSFCQNFLQEFFQSDKILSDLVTLSITFLEPILPCNT